MAFPHTFAPQAGPIPLQYLDDNFNAITAPTGSSLVGFIQSGTGAVARTVQDKAREIVDTADFDSSPSATSSVNTAAFQAAVTAVQGTGAKLIIPPGNYRINAAITAKYPIAIDGQMAQIYQETPNTDAFVFDKAGAGASNYQYVFDVQNLVVATVAGLGNAFVFRNINESSFKNLYVAGVGAKAFYLQGCLLNLFEHCYTGDGLQGSPGFFVGGIPTNKSGFVTEDYNGLGCNNNTFIRCSATNSTTTGFQVAGIGNTFINCDAEGISSPAVHMALTAQANVIGGDFEGTGNGIVITASNCVIHGVNALTFVEVTTGVKGTDIRGGTIKYPVFDVGSSYNTLENVKISTGGSLNDNGTNNTIRNITSAAGVEIGSYTSGTFTPLMTLGGTAVTSYFQQSGYYVRQGPVVFIDLWIQVNNIGAGVGNILIDLNDFPYTSKNTGFPTPFPSSQNGIINGAGNGPAIPRIASNSKSIDLIINLDTTGINTNLTNTAISSARQIHIAGHFLVA